MKIHNIDATGSFTYNGVDLSNLTGSTTDSGSVSTKIDNLNLSTSSLNSFTSSINTTIKSKLDSESVISGSVQVLITGTTGYSDFSSSISSSIGSLSGSVSTTTSNLSSSVGSLSSSIATTTSNLSSSVGNISSSIATTTSDLSSSIGSLSGSVATTTSGLASRIGSVESKTGSYATTGSNIFVGDQTITGSICSTGNIVTTGQIVAQTINVQQVTSSIVYSCGSNTFGCSLTNNQVFTGSMLITGSNITANVSTTCLQGSLRSCNLFLQVPSTAEVVDILRLNNPAVVNSGTRLKFENGYGDLAAIRVIHRDNGALADDGQIEFQVGSDTVLDTKMTILNTGQIGVGTLSPSAELQVNKNCDTTIAMSNCVGVTSGNRGTLAFYNCATSTVAMIRAAAVTDNVGTELQFHTRPAGGSIAQVMTLTSTGEGIFSNIIRSNATNGLALGSVDGYRRIQYDCASTNFGFLTDGNALANIEARSACFACQICAPSAIFTGRVGIGTTDFLNTSNFQMSDGSGASATPYMAIFNTASTPTVNASTRFDLGFLSGNSNFVATDTILGYINFMGQANDAGYGGAGIYAQVVSGGNVGRGSGHGVNLIFNTKATNTLGYNEHMRITSCGNIGIGTTDPGTTRLAVKSSSGGTDAGESLISATLGNESTMSSALVTIRNAGNRGNIGNANGSSLFRAEFTDATAMIINKDGNVGIKSISPRATLHVQQSTNDGTPVIGTARDGAVFTANNGNYGLNITVDPVGITHLQSMRFDGQSVGYNLILQPSACNVGIGTTSPGQRLAVQGNSYFGCLAATLNFSQGGNDRFLEVGAGSGGDALFIAHSSGYGVGYFGYESSNDRLVIATDCGGGANKIDFILNAGGTTGGATDNLNACPVMRITSGNLILACGRTSSIMASSGNIQEWVGLTGSIANNTGWSLFSITNQYDILAMDIYVFTDVGSFQASKHEAVFGYTQFVNSGIGYSSAFCIFQTGTLYNETMTICNLSGSNINNQRIAIRVWGYGVGQNGTGGSNLLTTSCLTRIK
jgi:hypothetical protein